MYSKAVRVALMGLLVAVAPWLGGCTSRTVPLGVTLDTPEHHVRSGMKFLDMGRHGDAMREFERCKELDPAFCRAYAGSGLVWAFRGDFEKALTDLQQARALGGTHDDQVFVQTGFIRLYAMGGDAAFQGWLQKAESAHKHARALAPEDPQADYHMARAYVAAAQKEKARRLFQRVVEINTELVQEAQQALISLDR